MVQHELQVRLNADGTLAVRQYTRVGLGDDVVTSTFDLEPGAEVTTQLKKLLTDIVEANRQQCGKEGLKAAVRHVAAVAGTSGAKKVDLEGKIAVKGSAG